MDSRELRAICRVDPELNRLCIGVFPSDKLPEKETGFIICNEDKHTEPGSHWLCIFLLPNKHAEFFNSYGGGPRPQPIADYLAGWDVVYSQRQVQGHASTACGQHVLYFAFHRVRGVPFNCIVDSYSEDLDANDQMVCEFVNDNFGLETEPFDEDMIYQQVARALDGH